MHVLLNLKSKFKNVKYSSRIHLFIFSFMGLRHAPFHGKLKKIFLFWSYLKRKKVEYFQFIFFTVKKIFQTLLISFLERKPFFYCIFHAIVLLKWNWTAEKEGNLSARMFSVQLNDNEMF